MKSKVKNWLVIPVRIAAKGITRIDYKLPGHVCIVTGIYCKAVINRNVYRRDFRAYASLGFNEGVTHPIFEAIDFTKVRPGRSGPTVKTLYEVTNINSVLQGYILDDSLNTVGFVVWPYTVKIYLSYE